MDLKIYIVQTSIEEKHIRTFEIEDMIKDREAARSLLRQQSTNETSIKINKDQFPELDPNITIAELRRDYDE